MRGRQTWTRPFRGTSVPACVTTAGRVVIPDRAPVRAREALSAASTLRRRRSTLGAIGAGITCAALIRKGAFFLPDAWVFPLLMAGVAVACARRPSRGERNVLFALGAFSAWWIVASIAWGVPSRAPLLVGTAVGFGAAFVIGRSFDVAQRAAIHRTVVALCRVIAAV